MREAGAGRRLTQRPGGKQLDYGKAHWWDLDLDYMVLVTCSSRGGVGGKEAIHMEIAAPTPHFGQNCGKGGGCSNTADLDLPCHITLFA